MLGQHREVLRREEAGVPPPDTTGTGMPACLNSAQRRLEEMPGVRIAVGKRHETVEPHPGQPHRLPRQRERLLGVWTPVRPNPVSHSTRKRRSTP